VLPASCGKIFSKGTLGTPQEGNEDIEKGSNRGKNLLFSKDGIIWEMDLKKKELLGPKEK